MVSRTSAKRADRRRIRTSRKRWGTSLGVMGGLALAAAALFVWRGLQESQAAFDYDPQDVSYEQPLDAIHEMGCAPLIAYPPRDGPQPEIRLSARFHDFGLIEPTEKVSTDFIIANVGTAPLTIRRAYTTCGCTKAMFSGSVIAPGMVSIVTVELDAGFHDVSGQTVRRGVIIENDDPDHSTMEFWIQATVR